MDRYHILLAMPGPNIRFATAQSAFFCSGKNHQVDVVGADQASWDNMNALWVTALNASKHDGVTHFVMIHSDIAPELGQDWVEIMLEEMESHEASVISVVIPIKDGRGLTSCGIGDPADTWIPFRRFTMTELYSLPETFTVDDTGYGGWQLNHNSGLIMVDLRDPVFRETKPDGELKIWFEFRKRCYMSDDGMAKLQGESEDWNFSRRLWENKVTSCVTRKVKLKHFGVMGFPNTFPWGEEEHDEGCRPRWEKFDPFADLLPPVVSDV